MYEKQKPRLPDLKRRHGPGASPNPASSRDLQADHLYIRQMQLHTVLQFPVPFLQLDCSDRVREFENYYVPEF